MSDESPSDRFQLVDPQRAWTRLGRFRVPVDRVDSGYHEDTLRAVMLGVVVVRCEMVYEANVFEYTALHADFDKVPSGGQAPWYDAVIHTAEGDITVVEWRRRRSDYDIAKALDEARRLNSAWVEEQRAPGWAARSEQIFPRGALVSDWKSVPPLRGLFKSNPQR